MTLHSKTLYFILSLILVGLSVLVDSRIHYRISSMFIYLIPVAVATFLSGKMAGITIATLSAMGWYLADVLSGREYENLLIPYWNATVRMFFFLITVFAIELKVALQREKEQGRTDQLTNAFNRRYFFENASREIERCRRYRRSFTLAFLDCDNLKGINDNQGHHAGDALLRVAAEIMKSALRATDMVVRFGGDEFILFMPETDRKAASSVIGRVKESLMQGMKQNSWSVTFSFGVITYLSPPHSADDMIKKSDELMYAVKKMGGNSIRHEVCGE